MIDDKDLQQIKDELLQAISYFVVRQELVAQALLDFGLDLNAVAILGSGGWTLGAEGAKQLSEATPNNFEDEFRTALQIMIDNKTPKINQTGSWQDKNGEMWNYFMHGGGCRLRHPTTDEVIDWDCPYTTHFDAFKFSFHLEWQIKKFPERYPNLVGFLSQNDINATEHYLFPELVNEGKLIKDLTNLYRVA